MLMILILGGSVPTITKNAEALVVATKESGIKVSTHKTKYMVMSQDKDARHCLKFDSSSFDRVEDNWEQH